MFRIFVKQTASSRSTFKNNIMTQEQKFYLSELIIQRNFADNKLLQLAMEIEDTGIVTALVKVAEKSIELSTSLANIVK